MTEAQQAFKEAEKELAKEKISEIKETMKLILQKIQDKKDIKAQAEEDLRILKLDLDDLREGKIEKIKERHSKSFKVRQVSPIKEQFLQHAVMLNDTLAINMTAGNSTSISNSFDWNNATSGTYMVACSNGTSKELFIG